MEEVDAKVMKANKGSQVILNHGNYEFEYEEFDFKGKHYEEHIGYRGKGEGNVT
jgi:hypothetical protein